MKMTCEKKSEQKKEKNPLEDLNHCPREQKISHLTIRLSEKLY